MTLPNLTTALSWYRREVSDALPARIHSRDVSEGGTPDWHPAFRAWLLAPAGATDKEGNIISPLKFWLSKLGRDDPARMTFLHLLILWDMDWRAAGRVAGISVDQAAHDFTLASLRRLFGLMYSVNRDAEGNRVVTPNEPIRPDRGDCEEQGCPNKTTRRWCRDHEKSDAQIDAERAAA